MRIISLGLLAGLAVLVSGTAQAQLKPIEPPFRCGELTDNNLPVIAPKFRSDVDLSQNNLVCFAWQDFIYMMWPAQTSMTQRGTPNPNAKFGSSGPTVWETFKTADMTFLPGGKNPGPWNLLGLEAAPPLPGALAQQVSSGAVRHLTQTSKVSREVLANLLGDSALPPDVLDDITQAGGGTLFDLNGYPVYYEVSVNETEYNYILQYQLYDAAKQQAYAKDNVIILPGGNDAAKPQKIASVEIKAAWKVMSDAEKKSGRFHMVQAVLDGAKTPVTVGLVGFHMFISNAGQGIWATFAQVDNVPLAIIMPPPTATYNFYNRNCKDPGTGKPCNSNIKNANPGQVVQVTPNDKTAEELWSKYMAQLLAPYSPWQYYKLVNVQWPLSPQPLAKQTAPAPTPLPDGKPQTDTMVNAVVETFLQKPKIGCLLCHQNAKVAPVGDQKPNYATSYSFIFKHASTAPQQ
jgi:hypothetical protein